jgi:ubiquinone/menaquinone biosynthesis C-methylase UbiE
MNAREPLSRRRTYGDADGYDAYMGGWSARLAPLFLRFALSRPPAALLDIGCGTGNLLVEARASFTPVTRAGIDPADALLARARRRPELGDCLLAKSVAEALPFADLAFDAALSLLVLQEFPEPQRALAEMRRVVRQGGIVAACQWDFARMPVIATLVEALVEVAPAAALRLRKSRVFTDEADLAEAWREAGLAEVVVMRIPVTRTFPDFAALWFPLLTGPTPSTMTLSALPDAERTAVHAIMQRRLASTEPFAITAEALAVRGVV